MIKLKSIQKYNPREPEAARKHYVQAVATGSSDLEKMAYLISNQSTVRESDCYAVILSLVHNIMDELSAGRIVKLDKLGTFQISVSSDGVETEEEVTSSLVNKSRINFRPDKRLKNMLSNLEFGL